MTMTTQQHAALEAAAKTLNDACEAFSKAVFALENGPECSLLLKSRMCVHYEVQFMQMLLERVDLQDRGVTTVDAKAAPLFHAVNGDAA
jgi:hypothetical protein